MDDAAQRAAAIAETVRQAWWSALEMPSGAGDENFFALGGDSATAMVLVQDLETVLDIAIPLELVFQDGTLDALTARCVTLSQSTGPSDGA